MNHELNEPDDSSLLHPRFLDGRMQYGRMHKITDYTKYVKLPRPVLRDNRIKIGPKMLYIQFLDEVGRLAATNPRADPKRIWFEMSQAEISQYLGVSRDSVTRYVKALEEIGLLEVSRELKSKEVAVGHTTHKAPRTEVRYHLIPLDEAPSWWEEVTESYYDAAPDNAKYTRAQLRPGHEQPQQAAIPSRQTRLVREEVAAESGYLPDPEAANGRYDAGPQRPFAAQRETDTQSDTSTSAIQGDTRQVHLHEVSRPSPSPCQDRPAEPFVAVTGAGVLDVGKSEHEQQEVAAAASPGIPAEAAEPGADQMSDLANADTQGHRGIASRRDHPSTSLETPFATKSASQKASRWEDARNFDWADPDRDPTDLSPGQVAEMFKGFSRTSDSTALIGTTQAGVPDTDDVEILVATSRTVTTTPGLTSAVTLPPAEPASVDHASATKSPTQATRRVITTQPHRQPKPNQKRSRIGPSSAGMVSDPTASMRARRERLVENRDEIVTLILPRTLSAELRASMEEAVLGCDREITEIDQKLGS